MANFKTLLGDVVNNVINHFQRSWQAGDRVTDPDNNVLAKLSEVTAAATGIQGSVALYSSLPDPTTLALGILYVVQQDTGAPNGNGLYHVYDNAGTNAWTFMDGLNLQNAGEVSFTNVVSGLTATDTQAAIDEVKVLTDAIPSKADAVYVDGSQANEGGVIEASLTAVEGLSLVGAFATTHETMTDPARDPGAPVLTNYVHNNYSGSYAENNRKESTVDLGTLPLANAATVTEVRMRIYAEKPVTSGYQGYFRFSLTIGGVVTVVQNPNAAMPIGWQTITFNATTDPTLFPISKANLDTMQASISIQGGGPTTSKIYAVNFEIDAMSQTAWAGAAPATLKDAVDRLANQDRVHNGAQIPE